MAGIMMSTISNFGAPSSRPAPPAPEDLYPFTNFIFTTANTFGRTGPNLSTLTSWYSANSVYSGNTWVNNTAYFNQTVQGYQLWTVPKTGTYTVTVAGARAGARAGGNASIAPGFGEGAVIRSSNISLTQGEKIQIVVGQEGLSYASSGSGGGGGGTFVVKYQANLAASANADIIMIAGGGGSINRIDANAAVYSGNTYFTANSNGGVNSTSGNAASKTGGGVVPAAGGVGGLGGAAGDYPGGGGGFRGNGTAGIQAGSFGIAYRFGANGGNANYTNIAALGGASLGGFGGGSGTHGFTGGGGAGGGYSGGGGGKQTNSWDMGGGGASYSVDPNYERVGQNRGPGYVIIALI